MTQKVAIGEASLRKVAAIVLALNPKVAWRIDIHRHQPKRTLSQNRLYFAVLTEMANETGHTKEELHDAMKLRFLPPQLVRIAGEEIEVPASTANKDKQAFAEFVDKVIAFASSELGISV